MRSSSSPVIAFFLFLAACSWPAHEATTSQSFEVDAAGIARLRSTTHNGTLEVVAGAQATTIRVQAQLSARGYTPEEARANLERLSVLRERVGDELAVLGKADESEGETWESFAFRIEVPAALGANLESHNGGIHVRGLTGDVAAVTHNGAIEVEAASARVKALSHNGGLTLDLRGKGALDATLETHNGNVDVQLGERSARIQAETHNGGLSAEGLTEEVVTEQTLRGKRGAGDGSVAITTHNGTVRIR